VYTAVFTGWLNGIAHCAAALVAKQRVRILQCLYLVGPLAQSRSNTARWMINFCWTDMRWVSTDARIISAPGYDLALNLKTVP